jgi:hypothetical protein
LFSIFDKSCKQKYSEENKQNNNKVKDWKRETPLAKILFLLVNSARKIA